MRLTPHAPKTVKLSAGSCVSAVFLYDIGNSPLHNSTHACMSCSRMATMIYPSCDAAALGPLPHAGEGEVPVRRAAPVLALYLQAVAARKLYQVPNVL
ncbi:hypothetical protein PG993_000285 [Apiospora rasikravindrae]|uniref:Uncharacterized protein n=1 Tax=Apiospora rasikravindrae TaxID=990691 RepID=A0ABR1U857_9PEZI